jgi:hypothetical protein
LENEHAEENDAKELVLFVVLKRRDSVRRRVWRMNMWRRTMLKRLFSWWILRRASVRRL